MSKHKFPPPPGEEPHSGNDTHINYDMGFSLISGTTNQYEITRQKSAALTWSEHTDVAKLDTLISVQTSFAIHENATGAITIG